MLAAIAEAILQVVFELVLEILAEIFGEVLIAGFERIKENAVLSAGAGVVAYALFGAVFGWLSTLVVSEHFIRNSNIRIANIILSPIILGFTLCVIGWIMPRGNFERRFFRINRFIAGV